MPPLNLDPPTPSAGSLDPVVEAYKKDVDRGLLRVNLKLSVDDRFRQFESFMRGVYELRAAGKQRTARRDTEEGVE